MAINDANRGLDSMIIFGVSGQLETCTLPRVTVPVTMDGAGHSLDFNVNTLYFDAGNTIIRSLQASHFRFSLNGANNTVTSSTLSGSANLNFTGPGNRLQQTQLFNFNPFFEGDGNTVDQVQVDNGGIVITGANNMVMNVTGRETFISFTGANNTLRDAQLTDSQIILRGNDNVVERVTNIGQNRNGSIRIFEGNRNTIQNVVVSQISVEVGAGNTIRDGFVGTNAAGTELLGISSGISVYGSNNVLNGNTIAGSRLSGLQLGTGSENRVENNRIGTDVTGTRALGNTEDGIQIYFGTNNTIRGNTISGNRRDGVFLASSADNNIIQSNFIGTDGAGARVLPNGQHGIDISSGTNMIRGNVISGNTETGIVIVGAGNRVEGNYIGTNATGTARLGNFIGVEIAASRARDNLIGGPTAEARNVISGNTASGIVISGQTTGNGVQGNYIGTSADGRSPLANEGHGVAIVRGASNNTISGTEASDGNLISGNALNGILIDDASQNEVLFNKIGTDATGLQALSNGENGVAIMRAADNTIARNLISGNGGVGVFLGSNANGNRVLSNFIGPDVTGDGALYADTIRGNAYGGIVISASQGNMIGGTEADDGNLISGNHNHGIQIVDALSESNVVQGNDIGTQYSGDGSLYNLGDGIRIDQASNNLIGGPPFAKNRIAYNSDSAVRVRVGLHNAIRANSIYENLGGAIRLEDGGNNEDAAPVMSFASVYPEEILVGGELHSLPNTDFTIEFFASNRDFCRDFPPGSEGKLFLGSTAVRTDGSGNATFLAPLVRPELPGLFFTATATENGNTSEFSNCVEGEIAGSPLQGR